MLAGQTADEQLFVDFSSPYFNLLREHLHLCYRLSLLFTLSTQTRANLNLRGVQRYRQVNKGKVSRWLANEILDKSTKTATTDTTFITETMKGAISEQLSCNMQIAALSRSQIISRSLRIESTIEFRT